VRLLGPGRTAVEGAGGCFFNRARAFDDYRTEHVQAASNKTVREPGQIRRRPTLARVRPAEYRVCARANIAFALTLLPSQALDVARQPGRSDPFFR
jgi:hypothetical protein